MKLAIINKETNIVENVLVPPEGAGAFFVAEGFYGVMAEEPPTFSVYNPDTGEFVLPEQPTEEEGEEQNG